MDTENSSSPPPAEGGSSSPEGGEKPKKKINRKPLWLLIPTAFETVPVDGVPQSELPRKPASYKVVQCHGKKDVQDALREARIDATNAEHVLLLRAAPTPLQLQSQLVIKW